MGDNEQRHMHRIDLGAYDTSVLEMCRTLVADCEVCGVLITINLYNPKAVKP